MKGFFFLICIGISLCTEASSFRVLIKNNAERLIQFTNADLISKLLDKEISKEEFIKLVSNDYEVVLLEQLQCSSLSDAVIVNACVRNLERTNQLPLKAENLSVYADGTNIFSEYFQEAFRLIDRKIHRDLRKFYNPLDKQERMIGEASIFTKKNSSRISNILSFFKQFPQVDARISSGQCDGKINADSLTLPAFEELALGPKWNPQACSKFVMEYLENLGLLASFGNKSSDEPFPAFHPKYEEQISETLHKSDLDRILYSTLLKIHRKGETLNVAQMYILKETYSFLIKLESSKVDILASLNKLKSFNPSEHVKYDGVLGGHTFIDSDFKNEFLAIASTMFLKGEDLKKIVTEAGLVNLFQDTNTEDESSRLELIDLISNLGYRLLKSNEPSIDGDIKTFLRPVFQHVVGLNSTLSHPLYIHVRKPDDSVSSVTCAFPGKIERSEPEKSIISFLTTISLDVEEIEDQLPVDLTFKCAQKSYNLKAAIKEGAPISHPASISYPDQTADILAPYSLTDEVDSKFKFLLKAYFRALGYEISTTKLSDVKAYMESQINRVDMLMPAGHILASRDLLLGTTQGELITAFKKKGRNEKINSRFLFVLPIKGLPTVSWKLRELTTNYVERIRNNLDPMMVFVLSCYSQSNLNTWNLVYRNSLEQITDSNQTFPYVIASERGFPTNSTIEIASNIFYISDLAEVLRKGGTPDDVYHFFMKQKYGSFGKELSKRLGSAWFPLASEGLTEGQALWMEKLSKEDVGSFSPVYNLSPTHRESSLKIGGINFQLISDGTVLMDETY